MRSLLVGFIVVPAMLFGQNPDIDEYLSRVERGRADDVRAELPTLLSTYPNNPGVLYLQGVLTTDGTEAVRVYQSIVDNFPKSDWADDALYKVYQFYYAIGLYRTAEIKLNQLKTDYPQSKHITGIVQADTKSLSEEKSDPPTTEPSTEPIAPPAQTGPPIAEERESQAQPNETTVRAQYTLQVGAYSQQVNAEKQKLFFEDLGYQVEVINKVRDSRSLFVVLVGEYKTADDARTKSAELKKKYNINSMMITR
ncbi:MAG: hypothetical protein HW412_2501 [Bacteroidetes bacterium]|nr:hypothetical protein [Bacteroidota bacterium]